MRNSRIIAIAAALCLSPAAAAQVFVSEVFINPPGSFDDTREFIELTGTPNMKLDGYAALLLFGMQEKFVPLGTVPPQPPDEPEIDEFLPLDGLTLGANGILVIGNGNAASYPLLPDTNFANWLGFWSGPLDVPNKLQNDGSITVLLVRNRPGITPTDPFDPKGPVWVKDSSIDREITFNVVDPQDGQLKIQVGDGSLDQGGVNAIGESMHDFRGKLTLADVSDDLEVVDEVSYEHDRGWEYDFDGRRVDVGSVKPGLEDRKVHQLDDPQGLNPDCLTRVDHRVKGAGWNPVAGGTGQAAGGKNWQDTSTEQWIRGETVQTASGIGVFPFFYYDVLDNADPNALQPYFTNVPTWLADGVGAEFPFTTPDQYQILAGHRNALAVPFVPGDADRDGDADSDDVAKIAKVFGDDDWVFSNTFAAAPQGDSGNPALQTRPWDVNVTGDLGVEPSDLQWALNFQGNTNGKIKGVSYDVAGPSATGVFLGDNSTSIITLDAQVAVPCGAAPSALRINDVVEITIRAQLTSGAVMTAGEQNGVMQFVHDLITTATGVVKVVSVEPIAPYAATRASYVAFPSNGEQGARRMNGHTTSFTQGLAAPTPLYRVKVRAIGPGNVSLFVVQSSETKLSSSTPSGIKLGHTILNGDPAAALYPAPVNLGVTSAVGGLIAEYGTGCIGTGGFTPKLEGSGCARPNGAVTFTFSQGKPGAVGNLFIGLGNTAANLNPNCKLQILPILPSPIVLPPLPGTVPGTGSLVIPGLIIPPTVPLGVSVYLQTLFADPAGFNGFSSTNPLQLTFGL